MFADFFLGISHYSLLTTHYSPLTTHHSPLTTHYSPLTTLFSRRFNPADIRRFNFPQMFADFFLGISHYSPLTTHYSLLTTHYSPLTTHHSLLTTHLNHSSINTYTSSIFSLVPAGFFLQRDFSRVCRIWWRRFFPEGIRRRQNYRRTGGHIGSLCRIRAIS